MTPKQLNTLEKLGVDTSKSEEEILVDLINIAEWLHDELERDEQTRFLRDIRRTIQKPSN